MSYNQALSAYKETRVKTASQGTLVVMLYDEAIKQMNSAMGLFETNGTAKTNKLENIHKHILKTQEIITELTASLNMDIEGEISKNLFSLYSFFNQQLLEANLEKKSKNIVFVRDMMNELRLAWIEVFNSTAVPVELQKTPEGVNIAG